MPGRVVHDRAEDWQWCGLWRRLNGSEELPPATWPVDRPRNWVAWVNRAPADEPLEEIRNCVERGPALGPETRVRRTAVRLGLEFTLRGPGRPRPRTNPIIGDVPFSVVKRIHGTGTTLSDA